MRAHPRALLAIAGVAVLALCVSGCALPGVATPSFANPPGQSSLDAGIYTNQTYQIRLRFGDTSGWSFAHGAAVAQSCPPPQAIFCASNSSRLLQLTVMLEDGGIPMTNADYHTLVRRSLREEGLVTDESIENVKLAGQESVIWTYNHTGDTIVQAYFQRGSRNYRVVLITPEDAFVRRRAEILKVVRSFEFLAPPSEA